MLLSSPRSHQTPLNPEFPLHNDIVGVQTNSSYVRVIKKKKAEILISIYVTDTRVLCRLYKRLPKNYIAGEGIWGEDLDMHSG